MKIETVYKGTCVLLGICFITMIGYNVGVSKGEETDASKDGIPDWWELTKPKVEWIELELWRYSWNPSERYLSFQVNITNTLDYPLPILGVVCNYVEWSNGFYPVHYPIWFLNTTEGWQYHGRRDTANRHPVSAPTNANALLPNKTAGVVLYFQPYQIYWNEETIYYEAYIESQHTIVKGVCEIPNITS